jgi:hypothetical protein
MRMAADAGLFHGDAIEDIGVFHRAVRVRDDDELGTGGHLLDGLCEAANVGLIERRIDRG